MTKSQCVTHDNSEELSSDSDPKLMYDKGSNCDIEIKEEEPIIVTQDSNTCQSLLEKDTQDPEIGVVKENEKLVAPDGGWGWFCVLACAMTHFLIGGLQKSGGLIFVQLRHIFQKSASETAWTLSLGTVLQLLLGPLSSSLSNKFSCRSVAMVGGVMSSLGIGLSIFATSLWHMYLTLGILGGIGMSLVYTSGFITVNQYFNKRRGIGMSLVYTPGLITVNQYFNKRRGIAVGLSVCGTGLGTFALPPCIELMFENFGFHGTLLIISGLTLNFCVCGSLYRPLKQNKEIKTVSNEKTNMLHESEESGSLKRAGTIDKEESHLPAGDIHDGESECKVERSLLDVNERQPKKDKKGFIIQWVKNMVLSKNKSDDKTTKKILELSLLKNVHFLSFCIVSGLFTLTYVSFNMFSPELMISRGLSELEAAYTLSIFGAVDAIARISTSVILDLKSVKYYRLLIYSITSLFISIGIYILPNLYGFHMFAVVSAILGTLTALYIGQISVVIIDILGVEKVSSSFGLLICFQGIGSLIGPPLAGFLRDVSDTYDQTFNFLASIIMFIFVTLLTTNLVFKYCKDRCSKFKNCCCPSH